MNRKLISMLAAAILLLGVLTACGGEQPQETGSGDLLAQIQAKGEMVIATEGTWAPWTYHDESDTLTGFDIEVAQAVCDKLGVKATFVEGEWDGLLTGLETGRYDTMANGVDITKDRAEKYDFSVPYAYIRTALMTRADDDSIQSFEDLAGKTTANTISSTYALLAEEYGAEVTGVDDLNQTIELLLQGRIDATLNAEVTYYDYIAQHPDANIRVAAYTDEANHVAMPFRKGAETETLRTSVDQALEELREDGTLGRISEKYFGSDLSRGE